MNRIEEAIKFIEIIGYNFAANYGDDAYSYVDLAIQALKEKLERERSTDGWVSIRNRLPETPKEVLVWIPNAGIYLGYYNALEEYKCWMKGLGECIIGVTHWSPTPKPPKEESYDL